ncbi:MAG TPA: nucleotide exchange factor GrpE [Pyrinomonadaceae bacterium]|jgi:molecular chaperone GrpE|nr:nucleotide exchange factor GrpE [Pyrinomonadaceae bacterium]
MVNQDKQKPNRIPVRFVDEEESSMQNSQDPDEIKDDSGDDELSPEELGRASSYEDATEMQRRIDRGAEGDSSAGREDADDADTAGGPPPGEQPERREDQDEAGAAPTKERRGSNNDRGGEQGSSASHHAGEAAAGPAVAELVATRAELKRVEAERADLLDQLSRRQADFDNYRKRTERERQDTYHRMVGDVVGRLLPVLDNLRRALDTEASQQAGESEEFRHFLQGVELIYKQLTDVLESLGLQPVAAVGQRFDPHVHEAVITEQTEDYEPDTVIQELVRGYRLGDKLLRPAVVKVATK